jgi:acyl carrier protein
MTHAFGDLNAVRQAFFDTLKRIAPEVLTGDLDSARPLRDQVDLGSLDWMNFLAALQEDLCVDIPEVDRMKLVTLDDLLAYLQAKVKVVQHHRIRQSSA